MRRIMILFFIVFQITSCKKPNYSEEVKLALNYAQDNSDELEKVIAKYSQKESDSLKLKAANYLISNMVYHKFVDKTKIYEPAFTKAKSSRDQFKIEREKYTVHEISDFTNAVFKDAVDAIDKSPNVQRGSETRYDIRFVDADFLIENIELAFDAYEKNPLKLCKNFNDFLEYILPYRVGEEPLEVGKRKELLNKYQWAFDSLKVKPLDKVIEDIYIDASLQIVWGSINYYPGTRSLTQIEQTRMATCSESSNYMINVFRSLGIPSGKDYCPRLGNWAKSDGHAWVFYLTQNGFESINVALDRFEKLNDLYTMSDMTKVFRSSFAKTPKGNSDITHLYKKAYDVNLEIIWGDEAAVSSEDLYLSVFDYDNGWDKVQKAFSVKGKKAVFKNMGSNLIYMPVIETNGQLVPVNYPFELTKNGDVSFLKPATETFETAILERKYMPFLIRDRKEKVRRMRSLNGCVLQGSNTNNANDFENLYEVSNHNTTNNVAVKLDEKACYRYFRLKGPEGQFISLANFKLLSQDAKLIENWKEVTLVKDESERVNMILDSDPLTYIDVENLELRYDLGMNRCITGFQIQARNDDNNVKPGDLYELFYWDKKWSSLGEKQAIDTMLTYAKVPKNSLFWLRNHSRGKEEFVFTLDSLGRQFWSGTTEYNKADSIMVNKMNFKKLPIVN